eukprot:TRINITY_DN15432_c0_g1_i3.p1 TRINITY_DN15432_c0_g1~~TRINITY_DN15432_c0_g1_i3.p1  ORF type:complete len:1074 (+),score=371.47 TRINITY_DN15432_c0_g1_i3:52-3222(+)
MAAAPRGRRSLPRGSVAYSPPRWQTEGPRTEVWDTKWPPPDAALLPRPEDPSGVLQGEEGATEALAMIERAPPSGWFTVKRELSDTLELPRAAALVDEGGCVLPGTDLSVRYVGDDGDDVEFRIEGGAIHYKQGDHRSPPFRFLEWTLRGAEGVQVGSFVLKDIGRRIVVTLGRPALGEMLAKLRLLADVANVQHNIGDAVEVRREKKSTLREIPVGYSAVGTVARSEVKWYPMGSRPHDPPLPGQRKELAAAADLASLDHQQRQASRNADQIFRIAGVPLLETSATLIVVPPAVLPVWLRGLGQRHPQLSFSRYEPPPQSAIHTRSVNSHIAAAPPASLTALPVEGPQSDVDVAARGIGGVRIVLISHAALQREVDAARLAVEQTRTPIGQLASPILRLRWWRVCVDLTDPQGVVSREARHVTDLARCVPAVHRWQVHPRGDQLAPAIQYSSSLATQAAKRKEQKSRFQAAVWTMEQVDHRERGDRWRAEDAARAALAEEEKRCRDLVTLLLLDRGSYAPVPKRWFDLLRAGERTLKHYPGDWDGKFNYVVTQELPRWRRRQQVRRGRAAMARVEAERFGSATRQAAEELFLITGQVQEKEDRAEMESAADDWCIRAHLCCSLLGGALAARVPTQSDEQSRWKRLMRSERNLNGRFYMCYLERVAREEVLLLEWQWLERLQREASEGTSRISEAEEEEVAYLYLRWDLRRHQDRWLVEREDLDERDAADVLREETWQRLGAEGAESCGRAELLHSARMWWQSAVVCWWAERVRIEQRDWLRLRGGEEPPMLRRVHFLFAAARLQGGEMADRRFLTQADALTRSDHHIRCFAMAVGEQTCRADAMAVEAEGRTSILAREAAFREFMIAESQELLKEYLWRLGHAGELESEARAKMDRWFWDTLKALGPHGGTLGYQPGWRWRARSTAPTNKRATAALGRAGLTAAKEMDTTCEKVAFRSRHMAAREHILRRRQYELAAGFFLRTAADEDAASPSQLRRRPHSAVAGRSLSPFRGGGPHVPRRLLPAVDLGRVQRPATAGHATRALPPPVPHLALSE